jgi:hypothetical protein
VHILVYAILAVAAGGATEEYRRRALKHLSDVYQFDL